MSDRCYFRVFLVQEKEGLGFWLNDSIVACQVPPVVKVNHFTHWVSFPTFLSSNCCLLFSSRCFTILLELSFVFLVKVSVLYCSCFYHKSWSICSANISVWKGFYVYWNNVQLWVAMVTMYKICYSVPITYKVKLRFNYLVLFNLGGAFYWGGAFWK